MNTPAFLQPTDGFVHRHIGPREDELAEMLRLLGKRSLDELIAATVPAGIRLRRPLQLGAPRGEHELLRELRAVAGENQVWRSYLGLGYHGTITPPVIQRNVLENPGWYTQYTPYQPEISQGRLEALINFQTLVADLTGLPLSNASLLDEGTAAAEAMHMCWQACDGKRRRFFVGSHCHPQTIAVVQTRAEPHGIEVVVGNPCELDPAREPELFGVLLQYPGTCGGSQDWSELIARVHAAGAQVVVATDLLALCLMKPPGEMGADIAIGSSQRFGVPMGFGGPHAAFMSAKDEHKRRIPGRIVGQSRDGQGRVAYRLALATREQHIRREKATSNICTAQVLLAVIAGMYAVYHGPEGLKRIATRVHGLALTLARGLGKLGFKLPSAPFFDTVRVGCRDAAQAEAVLAAARARKINLRRLDETQLVVALDETVYPADLKDLLEVFGGGKVAVEELAREVDPGTSLGALRRKSGYLTHPTFARYRSEHEMLRYLRRLEGRDLSLTTSMIPLGSCTMKLNATSEMLPVTWPEIGGLHPFAPEDQTRGWARIFQDLERWLGEITGLPAVSLQPNAGSQGEYAGLLVIRAFHRARGQGHRDVCLIPVSAHGTNPASAAMAALRVVAVKCDERGNIDLADLEARAAEHADRLAALMVTYPSTHGVFEEGIKQVCEIVHRHGGQVYMDGANMNAQVGLCRPGDFGADVLHLNLHKTFCIPHGGGGPGMGPICSAAHLAPFLPGHPLRKTGGAQAIGPVSAAPWGSPSILPISWVYIALMGASGLERASQVAILNANWLARRLAGHYDVLYSGTQGFVAHEVILDCRGFKNTANVTVEDIAKRLMDYSFHAPTVSFPVPGTLMIEPTESESLPELERFAEALIAIRAEIRAVEEGRADKADNALKHAPHTSDLVCAATWTRPYSRETAAYPLPWVRERKFWPTVGRIDGVLGDRNLICTCPPVEAFSEPAPVPTAAAAR